jgi:two-component system LytT family response regulator
MIVDDERMARQGLRDLLAAHQDFQIVAEAADITEAAQGVRRHRPKVLFLDIQMPGGDGYQLLDAVGPEVPFVVFVTAYDRYAVRAFEVNAVDYLLKPVAPARLAAAIERLRQKISQAALPAPAPVTAKTLTGLIPICAGCKKIRDERGYWNQVELYIMKHSDARFTHGMCPHCAEAFLSG